MQVEQLASQAQLTGAADIGSELKTAADVLQGSLGNLSTTTPITAGNFTVNGQMVSVGLTDTLQDAFDAIATATTVGTTLASLPMGAGITAGSFTIDGQVVTVDPSDTLQDVFDAIHAATANVTASYDPATDQIRLTSANFAPIVVTDVDSGFPAAMNFTSVNGSAVLGSAALGAAVTASYDLATDKVTLNRTNGNIVLGDPGDSSNFLTALNLASNGTGSVTSGTAVGTGIPLTLANLPVATPIGAGFFTVDGKQVAVSLTDSLESVLDAISQATSGAVTASYNRATDKITLTKANNEELVMGAANDTSNFLAVMKLANTRGATATSSGALGTVKATAALANARLRTALTAVDGKGSFSINGVAITYDTKTDTLNAVMNRINEAGAGVTAAFDKTKDRVVLTNKNTGDVGIALSETSGNLLATLGLSGTNASHFEPGKNASFYFNGETELRTSGSNTLDASVHGITGLSVTVNSLTTQILQVESDTGAMQGAIDTFIEKFNAVQDFVDEKTKVTVTGASVSTGVLTKNREVEQWANQLRSLAFDAVSGLTGDIKRIEHLGIDFDSTTGHLKVKDSGKLATALSDKPDEVEALFLTPSTGLVGRFYSFLTTIGTAARKQQDNLGTTNKDLDEQIATLQLRLEAQREQLTNSFIRMLDAQSTAQSQNTYLTNQFFKNNSNN